MKPFDVQEQIVNYEGLELKVILEDLELLKGTVPGFCLFRPFRTDICSADFRVYHSSS